MSALDMTIRHCANACSPAEHHGHSRDDLLFAPIDAFEAREIAKTFASRCEDGPYYYVMAQVLASIVARKSKARIVVDDLKRLFDIGSKELYTLRCLLLDDEVGVFDVTDEYIPNMHGDELTWVVSWA